LNAGHAVLRALRADPLTAGIRCVALSANATPADIEAARAAGFTDDWTKPVELQRLLAGIDRWLGTGHAPNPARTTKRVAVVGATRLPARGAGAEAGAEPGRA